MGVLSADVVRVLQIVLLVASVYGQSDVYWGSYELNIPGGSGAGNAVRDLKLPENAPEFFQFAAFDSQPFAAPQFAPAIPSAPRPAPLTVRQEVRPAPQLQQARPAPQLQQARPAPQPQQARPAPQPQQARPAPQPQQFRPAPQPQRFRPAPQQQQPQQQLRVFQSQQTVRQPQSLRPAQTRQPASRPAQIRQPAPRPAQTFEKTVQTSQPAQRFQNFAARTVERPVAPRVQPNTIVADNGVDNQVIDVEPRVEAPVDISDLSRFELYHLRQKLKKQKESQVIGEKRPLEATTEKAVDIQETTLSPVKIVPKRTRTGIRRKVARRKLVRNNA